MTVVGPITGYSTQAQIGLDVAEIINNRRIRFWFAAEFNPIDNAPASNPLRIFDLLDYAAKARDRASEKACSIADNLRAWVDHWEAEGLIDRDTQGRALQAIKTAFDDGSFAPQVFYLQEIVGAIQEEQPDEYRVENQLIDSPNVRRILPPEGVRRDRPHSW